MAGELEVSFDFETPYRELWVMKEGKSRGMMKLKQTIKTQEEYERFLVAIKNYTQLMRLEGRQPKYWLRWHTFCNNWRDYLDDDVTEPPPSGNKSQAERVLKGEL